MTDQTEAGLHWESRLYWDDSNRTAHQGRTFELWSHRYQSGISGKGDSEESACDAWHLHEVLGTGETCEEPLSDPLCVTRREAGRLAELWILGWRPAPGCRDMWRAPDQGPHLIGDVLSGATPH